MNNLLDFKFFRSIVLLCGNKKCKNTEEIAKYKRKNKDLYKCKKCGRVMFSIVQGGKLDN